jgi:YegS/Rv2252/BmrU family lipid kinase
MQATIVVHAASSQAERNLARLPELLARRNVVYDTIRIARSEKQIRRFARRARKAGAELLIAGGGDGTMATIADVLAHSDTVLGVLPLGTGNSFAQTLGIPEDLEAALDAIVAHRVVKVDLGRVNGTYFANFATIGLAAEAAEAVPKPLKPIIGPLAYVVGAIKPFLEHKPFRARVRWDGGREKLRTQQIVVASGRYFGHQPIARDASIVDRRLAFFTTTGVSHAEVARTYLAMALGVHESLPDAVTLTSKEIVVKTKPRQPISIDGNTLGKTPGRFHIEPRALRVCVGPTFVDART